MEAVEAKPITIKRKRFRFKDASADLIAGIRNWRVWLLLGWLDVKLRYRRSYLGPFWITISMAIMIYSMGFVYSRIFKMDTANYFLYISTGMLAWVLLSTSLIEMMNCFIEASTFIMQVKMPYSVYILRIITRNFIILGHNMLAVVPLLIYFKIVPDFTSLLFTMGVIAVSMFSVGMLLAMVGTRYRDVQQVIASILQIGFLLTPIMWKPEMLPGRVMIAVWLNPFYHYVELLRSSFMGVFPPALAWKGALMIAAGGTALMVLMFARARHRLAFWV